MDKQQFFSDQFGLNAGFVSDLYEQYSTDPKSVPDYWQEYFRTYKIDIPKNQMPHSVKQQSISAYAVSDSDGEEEIPDNASIISGVGAKIIENMEVSLTIPTATSLRAISVKLLEENRRIINYHLIRINESKISYSHIVAFAIVKSLRKFPSLNNSYLNINGKPHLVKKDFVNLGIAVDTKRKDGSRSLIVPNIKTASKMNFTEFRAAYDEIISKARNGRIEPADFQDTTISITNPGGIGTVASTPRLMKEQGCILAIGAIDYPAEFKAMSQTALASLGVGKVMNITSTYDHRIIQGAESGEFLNEIDRLLRGEERFYEKIFDDLKIPQQPVLWGVDTTSHTFGGAVDKEMIEKQAKIPLLINIYRVRGHLISNINPLSVRTNYYSELDPATYGFTIWDYDREFISNFHGMQQGTLREILDALRQTYCEMIGAEFMHIQNPIEKQWLMNKMETVKNHPSFNADHKKRIMKMLSVAEGFEHFLHTKFIGHKRFSLEGSETLIPVLDYLLALTAEEDIEEVILGMAHRGRLNVLANIMGKAYEKIFAEFEDNADPDMPQGTGDVKYHLGASGTYKTFYDKKINVTVASNPSHLEFVDAVVEGIVRAKQTRIGDTERVKVMPLLIHGDAAFAGQGVVAETLNLSQLAGYRTGGTVHIIINNQIGFTTGVESARSSPYATDVAKMVQAPIFHVNGDDPEASLWITRLALEYRQAFNKDVVIDLFGYRRHGHNEGDDPVYTQPLMYKKIKSHPSVREIYRDKLITEKVLSKEEIKSYDDEIYSKLDTALDKSKEIKTQFLPDRPLAYNVRELKKVKPNNDTAVTEEIFKKLISGLTSVPEDFALNPKLKRTLAKRKKVLLGEEKIDWAFAEALSFGALLLDGFPVRLSGQDSARGTFSQRHLILTDMNTGEEVLPLNFMDKNQAKIEALDSLLSENAVLGFEYGYAAADPLSLVLWEAQFGDFANGAQVIIDNFIAASEVKWNLPNGIVLLLPHGQEGQGPEHSSARIERFLILCAQNNMIIAYPTTPAQYFHLLRRQVMSRAEKPLVVFTPKSLLRLPAARSEKSEVTDSQFMEIIDDGVSDKTTVKRIILTSGKLFYELDRYKTEQNREDTAIIRIEQYYPLDIKGLKNILRSYTNAKKIIWAQEEPQNMGAWNFIYNKLSFELPKKYRLEYCGREESPSPAFGSYKKFQKTQEELIKNAFNK